jgi:hypothetical protein
LGRKRREGLQSRGREGEGEKKKKEGRVGEENTFI